MCSSCASVSVCRASAAAMSVSSGNRSSSSSLLATITLVVMTAAATAPAMSQAGAAEGHAVDGAAALGRLGLLAQVGLARLAHLGAALGDVDDVPVAQIEPAHRELEVGRGAGLEAQDPLVPCARGLDVLDLQEEMFQV